MVNNMKEKKYQKIVERHKPKEERAKFALISFIVGGLVGVLGEGLICFYVCYCDTCFLCFLIYSIRIL